MPVTQTRIHGVNMLLHANATLIGGFDNAELVCQLATENVVPQTPDLWPQLAGLVTSWAIRSGRVQYLEGAGTPTEIAGSTGALSYGGTTVSGWQSVTLNTTIANPEVTDINDALVKAVIAGQRTGMTLVVRGNYYDHEATLGAGHKKLYAAWKARTSAATILTFGAAQSYTFTGLVTGYRILPRQGNAAAQFEATISGTGAMTDVNTNVDAGLGVFLDACFATTPASITPLLFLSTSNTQFTGTSYPSRVSLTLPSTGNVTGTIDLEGTGALTESVTA